MPERRAPAAPTINLASVAYGLDRYLLGLDVDPGRVLRDAGLATEELTDPDRRVPLVRYLELLEICAEASGDPQFGLKFGVQYDPRHAGVVGNVALASRTVGDALALLGRYLPTMVDAAVFGAEVAGGRVFAYQYYVDPLMMSYSQKTDWTIGFLCHLMRRGLGRPDWSPSEALFPHLPDETTEARRSRSAIIGGRISSGHSWAGIRFDAALLAVPLATADGMLERLMRHYGDLRLAALADGAGDVEPLRREVARLLVKGESSLARLAEAAGMSSRTLQRRLGSAGISYSALVDGVRRTLALNLLENDGLALKEIAFALGYSDLSAFNHAFRRWTGRSPGEHRAYGRTREGRRSY